VTSAELLPILRTCAAAIAHSLEGQTRRGYSGLRDTQYHLDLAADRAALDVLVPAGFRVLSEESGTTGTGEMTVVIDPVDGSTNCDRGIPFYATSLAVVGDGELLAALVVNLATGTRYEALRGEGAWRDGARIHSTEHAERSTAIMSFSGLPDAHAGWGQVRSLGAASLECCLVADGSLDLFAVTKRSTLYPWDYLAGLLVARESGAVAADYAKRELVIDVAESRQPIFASSVELLEEFLQLGPL
jgi:myo-inositol-1(or 4)-monophosphatase